MISPYMLRRARPENVRRLARALGLEVKEGETHAAVCNRVSVALWRLG